MDFKGMVEFVRNSKETADDQTAVKAMELYPLFSTIVGTYQKKGTRVRDEKNGVMALFKLDVEDQTEEGTMILENWTPGNAPAIWTAINEEHAGTIKDPIHAVRGMEYVYGLFYVEGSTIYKCWRKDSVEGEKIILQYLPSELIDQYFILAEEEK